MKSRVAPAVYEPPPAAPSDKEARAIRSGYRGSPPPAPPSEPGSDSDSEDEVFRKRPEKAHGGIMEDKNIFDEDGGSGTDDTNAPPPPPFEDEDKHSVEALRSRKKRGSFDAQRPPSPPRGSKSTASSSAAPTFRKPVRRAGGSAKSRLAGKMKAKRDHQVTESKVQANVRKADPKGSSRSKSTAHSQLAAAASAKRGALRKAGTGKSIPSSRSSGELTLKTTKLNISGRKAVNSHLSSLASEASDHGWVILEVQEDDSVNFLSNGPGRGQEGLDEVKEAVDEAKILFVFLNLGPDSKDGIAGGVKIGLLTWIGDYAKAIQKARSGPQRADLIEYSRAFFTVAADVTESDVEELKIRTMINQMKGFSGSVSTGAAKVDLEDEAKKALAEDSIERRRRNSIDRREKQFALVGKQKKDVDFSGKDDVNSALFGLCSGEAVNNAAIFRVSVGGESGPVVEQVRQDDFDDWESKEWCSKYLSPTEAMAVLLRVDLSERGYGSTSKLVYVEWIGDEVKHLEKAKIREFLPSLSNYVYNQSPDPISAEFAATSVADLSPDNISLRVSGSRMRGNTVAPREAAVSVEKQAKFNTLGKQKSELRFHDEEKLKNVLESMLIKDDVLLTEPTDTPAWVAIGYREGEIDVLELSEQGFTQVIDQNKGSDLSKVLREDTICFVFHRVLVVPSHLRDSSSPYARPFFGVIRWMGEKAGVMETALSSHHWEAFLRLINSVINSKDASLQPGHIRLSDLADLDRDHIIASMKIKV